VLIGGFIVGGTGPKQLVLRAPVPTLTQFGVPGALPDPMLELRNSTGGLLAFNDNWGQAANAQSMPVNLRPLNTLESAISPVSTLAHTLRSCAGYTTRRASPS
jgi:hypothetical protein